MNRFADCERVPTVCDLRPHLRHPARVTRSSKRKHSPDSTGRRMREQRLRRQLSACAGLGRSAASANATRCRCGCVGSRRTNSSARRAVHPLRAMTSSTSRASWPRPERSTSTGNGRTRVVAIAFSLRHFGLLPNTHSIESQTGPKGLFLTLAQAAWARRSGPAVSVWFRGVRVVFLVRLRRNGLAAAPREETRVRVVDSPVPVSRRCCSWTLWWCPREAAVVEVLGPPFSRKWTWWMSQWMGCLWQPGHRQCWSRAAIAPNSASVTEAGIIS